MISCNDSNLSYTIISNTHFADARLHIIIEFVNVDSMKPPFNGGIYATALHLATHASHPILFVYQVPIIIAIVPKRRGQGDSGRLISAELGLVVRVHWIRSMLLLVPTLSVARSKQVCIEWMEATVLFPIISMDNE